MSSLRIVPLIGLTLSSLIACSAGVGALPKGSGGGTATGSGGAGPTGSGGTGVQTSGGSFASSGGALGPGSGGAATSSGGAFASSGGAATGSGGAATSSGGAATSDGGAATGPGCSATAFTVSNKNYADNGTFCGYAWTASNGEGETVDPPCGTGMPCFEGKLCANITLPANDPDANSYTGAMIGWSIAQATSGTESTFSGGFTSITPTFTKTGLTGEVRVLLQSSNADYCVANATSGKAMAFSDFQKECWDGGAMTAISAGTAIKAIALQINGSDAAQDGELCLTGLTVAK